MKFMIRFPVRAEWIDDGDGWVDDRFRRATVELEIVQSGDDAEDAILNFQTKLQEAIEDTRR